MWRRNNENRPCIGWARGALVGHSSGVPGAAAAVRTNETIKKGLDICVTTLQLLKLTGPAAVLALLLTAAGTARGASQGATTIYTNAAAAPRLFYRVGVGN